MKGMIALDIDGTITSDLQPTPQPVVDYLHALVNEGWTLVFITGRTFHMGYEALKPFTFPYYYAFQNGAAILQMPERNLISRNYLSKELLGELDTLNKGLHGGFIIYSGYECNDRCLYVEKAFEKDFLNHLLKRSLVFKEEWVAAASFKDIQIEAFPVIKYFGDEESAKLAAKRIEDHFGLETSVIRDPFDPRYSLMQATAAGINKGQALQEIQRLAGVKGKTIAAGDDRNDWTMFDAADICVAMEDAPDVLKQSAHILAPPANQMGIIDGLKLAIKSIGG